MISDIFMQAVDEMDEYLNDPAYKEIYSGEALEDILLIKKLMIKSIYGLTLTDALIYLGNWKFIQLEENGWYYLIKDGDDWFKLVPKAGYTNLGAAKSCQWDKVLIVSKPKTSRER